MLTPKSIFDKLSNEGSGGAVFMSVHRLTVVPQPDAVTPVMSAEGLVDPDFQPVEVVSIAHMGREGRWRTEAMRSYARPVLIWFTRGQGRMTVAGQTMGYGPHNIIFLPSSTMHGFSVPSSVMGYVTFLPEGDLFNWPIDALHLRLQDGQSQRELTGMIDSMLREGQGNALRANAALLHYAGLMSVWLERTVHALTDAEERGSRRTEMTAATRLAAAFSALVERDFRKPVGVQHFAGELGVTPTHLTRVCRQVSGRAALDILSDRRHFEARRLLRDSRLQISDIAKQTGFASAAYFTRAFRSRSGQSPSEFRSTGP